MTPILPSDPDDRPLTDAIDHLLAADANGELASNVLSPRERTLFTRVAALLSAPTPGVDERAMADRVAQRIRPSTQIARPHTAPYTVPSRSKRPWLTAGLPVAGALLVIGYAVTQTVRHRTETAARAAITYDHRYETHAAQVARVTLDDGTQVTLAPNSVLQVRNARAQRAFTTRDVSLSGEASFEVEHAARVPLVIHTGDIVTRVLGTSFDIRRYNGEMRLAVVSGRVEVTTPPRGNHDVANRRQSSAVTVIGAGTVLRVTDSTTVTTNVSDVDRYQAWTRGSLVFRDAPVPEVLETLGKWYGYEFRLADQTTASQHLNAIFTGTSPSDMLRALQGLLGVTMSFESVHGQQGETTVVTLHPRTGSGKSAPNRRAIYDSLTQHREVGR